MTKDELRQYIAVNYADVLAPLETGRFDPWYTVKPEDLVAVARKLRDDPQLHMDYLCNISGVDTKEHFEAAYALASIKNSLRMDIKVILPYDAAEVDSVQEVWAGANWHEREMWELYGIDVKNHGNLTRFILPEDWDQGYPLRKDWDAPDFERMPED